MDPDLTHSQSLTHVVAPMAVQPAEDFSSHGQTVVENDGSPTLKSPARKTAIGRLTSGFGLRLPPKTSSTNEAMPSTSSEIPQPSVLGSFTRGLVDSSRNAVKAVQVRARHMVSQNKRRYQEGGFDLDMTYITENIIAMGFPAGDISSGFFGYVEGFYRNHMEEVIKFFESHHKGKYKVYNLCSERLYDASLFEGKVACFPFDDHNCPPIQLIISFCQSAYAWLKEDIENVVVVHCKAGMARTGLMISSLLLFLKFFPTAEESIEYYNQKRCFDGKALVLPSQIRYVKYFERILTYFNGDNQPARRCLLRGFRLHRCPYWIRPSITVSDHGGVLFSTKKHPKTKDLMPEDFWFNAPRKGVMVFALPGEPGLAQLAGDFKVHFYDRQGDFYCWLNTTMMENRKVLTTADLDGFDKRKLPSPGFLVEIVLVDYHDIPPKRSVQVNAAKEEGGISCEGAVSVSEGSNALLVDSCKACSVSSEKDDVFSDGEVDDNSSHACDATDAVCSTLGGRNNETAKLELPGAEAEVENAVMPNRVDQDSVAEQPRSKRGSSTRCDAPEIEASAMSEFKALAADASVFSFGDYDDYIDDDLETSYH